MALSKFISAVNAAAAKYGPEYGIEPSVLAHALLTAAALEGGLGEEAAVGDGGKSYGRFQFYTGGGHGSTLLNQGYSIEELADDEFQAWHWAPLLAQSLVQHKDLGTAIFKLERPKEMYPASRLQSSMQQASDILGTRTTGDLNVAGEGAQPSGTVHSLQELNAEIERARTAALEARKRAALDPEDFAAADAATEASAYYIELEGLRLDLEAADANRANDAFSAGIQLGDFQGRQADRAFGQYMDKRDAARTAAQAQIDSAKDRNLINADVEKARYENFGQGPQADTRTYFAPNFSEALERWEKEYGVGEQPSGNPADYGGPALPGSGGGGQPLIPTQTGGVSHYEGQRVVFSDDQYGMNPGAGGNAPMPGQGGVLDDQTAYADYGPRPAPRPRQTSFPPPGGGKIETGTGTIDRSAVQRAGNRRDRWWLDWEGQQQPNRYADGTTAASPGKAYVGEKGPEVMIGPDGRPRVIGQWGPEVMDMQGGEQIIPNGVPPDEAFAYSQIQNALKQQGDSAARPMSMADRQARATDPQLQEKVLAALQQAVVAQTVAQPPLTPTLNGQWTKPDPWSDWRGLTGVPPVPMEAAV